MWRTNNGCLVLCVVSCTLGCSGPSSAPVAQSASEKSSAAQAIAPQVEELTFDAQYEKVLAGESIAIRLTRAKVSVEQLQKLVTVGSKLLELQLDAGVVDDTALESIGTLTELEHLRLRDSPITDAGLVRLDPRKLAKLRIINLPQANLTVAGLEHLATFPNLVQVRLSGMQLDDRAAEVFARFPSLRSLHLIAPKFSDLALDRLAKAPKLSSLYIDDCHLSDAAWERLFVAKPSLHVHIDQHHHDRDPKADH